MTDHVRAIADAVLYEGYILWPYRRSATKNRQRWTFGGVYPPEHSREHPDDPSRLQAQVLLEARPDATADVVVRFLQVVERRIARGTGCRRVFVDELTVAGERHLAWDEAVEREVHTVLSVGGEGREVAIDVRTGSSQERLGDEGAIVRTWQSLRGSVDLHAEAAGDGLFRLTVRVRNETPWAGDDRQEALRRTFCSTHVVLHAEEGAFVSASDPPPAAEDAAAACDNSGLWPVLVGDDGARETMLAAPIILSDYPQVAPESPGDLFDATEIDKLLILNVLALTPEEQAEMRASDPRAREILDRCAALSPEELMRLHGAIREFRPAIPHE
jgi:hypothetical protein